MNRKTRRSLKRGMGEESAEKISQKISNFNALPDKCDACNTAFDKKSKDMTQTWRVVAREEPSCVRLFCPKCIEKTKEVLENER